MKQDYFIKFDRRINNIIGCQRATLILSTLEYWFSKKQEGFYKFIGPCSHPLYKKEDSWTEELGCDPKSFTNSFKKIGVKYKSRTAFEKVEDKFQGKMYASYYDRYSNRVFFVRNHEEVNKFFARIYSPVDTDESQVENKKKTQPLLVSSSIKNPLRNGKNYRSYKEAKNTSNDLSKDKYHANDEIVKKMVEFWTALVEGGKGKIEITSKRTAFLKQAFKDKFDSCLEKWKKYCQDIASSRFLMGEIKSSFRATLDWALKFDIIQKIHEGNYGIGDRNPLPVMSAAGLFAKNSKIEIASEAEVIQKAMDEPLPVREFRLKWLNKFGAGNYRECLKGATLKVEEGTTLILRPSSRYNAKTIASWWVPALLDDSPFTGANIIQEENGLVFDKWFGECQTGEGSPPEHKHETAGVKAPGDLNEAALILLPLPEIRQDMKTFAGRSPEGVEAFEGEQPGVVAPVSAETQMLREQLRQVLPAHQFPGWLGSIEVEHIGKDGKIVVALEEPLAVEWCRLRFSQEIFQAAASLWKGVVRLVIRQKAGNTGDLSVEKIPQQSENVTQKPTWEQAIQSLLSACPSRSGETRRMQACEAFG